MNPHLGGRFRGKTEILITRDLVCWKFAAV